MVAADARTAVTFALSPSQAGDAPQGWALLQSPGSVNQLLHLLMDKACEGDQTRPDATTRIFVMFIAFINSALVVDDSNNEHDLESLTQVIHEARTDNSSSQRK